MEEAEEAVFWRVALALLRWTVAVEDADEDSGPREGVSGGRSAGGSACPFTAGTGSEGLAGMVWSRVLSVSCSCSALCAYC